MFIFIDPSELKSNSRWPKEIDVIPCDGLEALTGADFVISKIPVSPVNALSTHIKARSLFVQRKSGWDAIGDFNQIWLEIARMQLKKIPMQQTFILIIGKINYVGIDGSLQINGSAGRDITYKTYLKMEAELGYSGIQVRRLNDESELPVWIEAQYEELLRIESRDNLKEVVRPGTPFVYDDPFQEVKEIDDWRSFLLSGVKGIGIKTVNNLDEYILKTNGRIYGSGIYALKILTDENDKGKAVHKIPGFGRKRRKDLRLMLGIPDDTNLDTVDVLFPKPFTAGWYSALDRFKELVEEGVAAKEAWHKLRNEEIPF